MVKHTYNWLMLLAAGCCCCSNDVTEMMPKMKMNCGMLNLTALRFLAGILLGK